MKNILFISDNDGVPWGGSEELWSLTAKALAPHYNISVLLKKWPQTPSAVSGLIQANVRVFYRNDLKKSPKGFINKLWFQLFGVKKKQVPNLFNTVKELESYDLVVISVCDSVSRKLVSYTEVLNEKRIRYVILVQLATDLRMVPDPLALALKGSYEQAQCVCFLSPENAQKTQLLLGCTLQNIQYVNNPFHYVQDYVAYNGEEHHFSMACVASLKSFHKGQDILISLLGQDKWKSRNFRLNLYGDGVNRNQLQRLVSLFGLEDKVFFLGFESDKHRIWSTNMVCMMPSRMEGQSLAMLEAMSFGRMVISTKVGDAERLITHGRTGFLADYPSFEALDLALDAAWDLRHQWLDMGKLSREKLYEEIPIDPIDFFANKIKSLV